MPGPETPSTQDAHFWDVPLKRHPGASFREVGEDVFLVHADGDSICNLNPMGAALWRLMEDPLTPADMAEIVFTAFPAIPEPAIRKDIEAVLTELLRLGYVEVG